MTEYILTCHMSVYKLTWPCFSRVRNILVGRANLCVTQSLVTSCFVGISLNNITDSCLCENIWGRRVAQLIYWRVAQLIYWGVAQFIYWRVAQLIYWRVAQFRYWRVVQFIYWRVAQLIYWRVAQFRYWSVAQFIYWRVAQLIYWGVVQFIYWRVAQLIYWRVAQFRYWRVAQFMYWCVAQLTYWRVAQLIYWRVAQLVYWRVAQFRYWRVAQFMYWRVAQLIYWRVAQLIYWRPDPPWGPPSILYNEYRVFPGGKAAGAWRWPSTPSSADVKEKAELYLYSPSRLSWPVLGWPLPLLYHYISWTACQNDGAMWQYLFCPAMTTKTLTLVTAIRWRSHAMDRGTIGCGQSFAEKQ